MRQSIMYALEEETGYRHFYKYKHQVRLTGIPGRTVELLLTEDIEGDYWAWWDNKTEAFVHCWPSEVQLNMCFPYGPKAEEDRDRGNKLRVSVKPT
ncbi:hypothetical protein LCGC14_0444360 [marine sediment metagenome]|uniref:Uncharacterized protein n=1 Tax=marine sediment metagenome TaxID=412755 RepID=A0A0F9T2S2_9ZZZZ